MVSTDSILRVNNTGKELHMDSEKGFFYVSRIEFEKNCALD